MNRSLPHFRLLAWTLLAALATAGSACAYSEDPMEPAPARRGTTLRSPSLIASLFFRPAKDNSADQLGHAIRLEDEGRARRARRAFQAVFLFWPASPEAPEAVRRYAAMLEAGGAHEEAFKQYQYLVDNYSGFFSDYGGIVQTQFELANQRRDARAARWLFGGFASPERALPLYFQVVSNAPNSDLAPESLFQAARLYQDRKEYEREITVYSTLQTRYPLSDQAGAASFQVVRAMFDMADRNPYHHHHSVETRAAVARYLQNNPDSEHAERAREMLAALNDRLAQALIDRARVYRKAGRPALALDLYRQCAREFPNSTQAQYALDRLADAEPPTQEPAP